MLYKIISVGKKHDVNLVNIISEYEKRLSKHKVEWVFVKQDSDIQKEGRDIISKLKQDDFVILLDEEGKTISSIDFSKQIQTIKNTSKNCVFIIGGAFGVSEEVSSNANLVLGLGKMVFPHQLVRLILIEQIYRAEEILKGSKYHHE